MKFLYKGKWVEYDGLCDDAKCPDNLNGHCHKEYWKEYECKERKKEKDTMARVVTHVHRLEVTPEMMENFRKNFRAIIAVWFGRCTALADELDVSRQAITKLMSDTQLINNRYFYSILYVIFKNLYGYESLFDLTADCLAGIVHGDKLMLNRIYMIIDEQGNRLHSDPLYTNKDIMKYIVNGKAEVSLLS